MPTEKVNRLKDTAQAITSLDTPIGDDGAALQDFLEDDSAVGPDELAVEAVGREALEQVLAALPERERQVLILRFGLDSGTPDPGGGRRRHGVLPRTRPPGGTRRPGSPPQPRNPGPPGGPRRGLMRRFAITHDYLCPFARNTSRRNPPLQCGVAAPQALRGRLYLPAGEPYPEGPQHLVRERPRVAAGHPDGRHRPPPAGHLVLLRPERLCDLRRRQRPQDPRPGAVWRPGGCREPFPLTFTGQYALTEATAELASACYAGVLTARPVAARPAFVPLNQHVLAEPVQAPGRLPWRQTRDRVGPDRRRPAPRAAPTAVQSRRGAIAPAGGCLEASTGSSPASRRTARTWGLRLTRWDGAGNRRQSGRHRADRPYWLCRICANVGGGQRLERGGPMGVYRHIVVGRRVGCERAGGRHGGTARPRPGRQAHRRLRAAAPPWRPRRSP